MAKFAVPIVVICFAFGTGCTNRVPPTAPSATPGASTIAPAASGAQYVPLSNLPSMSHPGRVYEKTGSRYVLYDDGSFVLEYASLEYRGTYEEADGVITFIWLGWSVAGPWGAVGLLKDDSLSVRYNLIMQLTDFEDGVYYRVPANQP